MISISALINHTRIIKATNFFFKWIFNDKILTDENKKHFVLANNYILNLTMRAHVFYMVSIFFAETPSEKLKILKTMKVIIFLVKINFFGMFNLKKKCINNNGSRKWIFFIEFSFLVVHIKIPHSNNGIILIIMIFQLKFTREN